MKFDIVNGVLKKCILSEGETEAVIPDSVKMIGERAFYYCGIKKVTIPSSVLRIGREAFFCCHLFEIDVDLFNPVYQGKGNCLIDTVAGELIKGCDDSVIPYEANVIKICENAFRDCFIERITIPNSVKEIEDHAFFNCFKLKKVEIPDSVEKIGIFAFSECSGLKKVMIPDSVKSIGNNKSKGNWAFYGCRGMIYTPAGSYADTLFKGARKVSNDVEEFFADN